MYYLMCTIDYRSKYQIAPVTKLNTMTFTTYYILHLTFIAETVNKSFSRISSSYFLHAQKAIY